MFKHISHIWPNHLSGFVLVPRWPDNWGRTVHYSIPKLYQKYTRPLGDGGTGGCHRTHRNYDFVVMTLCCCLFVFVGGGGGGLVSTHGQEIVPMSLKYTQVITIRIWTIFHQNHSLLTLECGIRILSYCWGSNDNGILIKLSRDSVTWYINTRGISMGGGTWAYATHAHTHTHTHTHTQIPVPPPPRCPPHTHTHTHTNMLKTWIHPPCRQSPFFPIFTP